MFDNIGGKIKTLADDMLKESEKLDKKNLVSDDEYESKTSNYDSK